jgi:hypothetical protein
MSYDKTKDRDRRVAKEWAEPLVALCGNIVRADGAINGSKCDRSACHVGFCSDRSTGVSWQGPKSISGGLP